MENLISRVLHLTEVEQKCTKQIPAKSDTSKYYHLFIPYSSIQTSAVLNRLNQD